MSKKSSSRRCPGARPLALTSQFSKDAAKVRQWQAFLNKNCLNADTLVDTVALLDLLLWPPTVAVAAQSGAIATWMPQTAGGFACSQAMNSDRRSR